MESCEIIAKAINEVLDEELAEYLNGGDNVQEHQFSEQHLRKMKKLIRQQRKPYYKLICTAGRRVACIFAAVLILSASALSVRAGRETVVENIPSKLWTEDIVVTYLDRFTVKTYPDHYDVRTDVTKDTGYPETIEEEYHISAPLEGYTRVDCVRAEALNYTYYYNAHKHITFVQEIKYSGTVQFGFDLDRDYTDFREYTDDAGNETYLIFYSPNSCSIIWDNGRYIFKLSGNLDKEAALNLCRSIKVKE